MKMKLIRHGILLLMCGLLTLSAGSGLAAAADSAEPPANTVAQSYNAGQDVLTGMIVRLKPKDKDTVVPVGSRDVHSTIGIVAPIDGASIVLTPPSANSRQVLVAPTGRYNLLVSDQGGAIKPGDYLTISALEGIGMKAGSEQSEVVGRAAGSFDGKSNVLETVNLKTVGGQDSTVSVSSVQADIRLAPNPLYRSDSNLPGFLAKAAASVANRQVDPARVYLSIAVLLATLFITGSMFYGGIRGSITAIGRNPLAKGAINRGMLQSTVFGIVVFVLGMLAAYAVLL